MTYWGQLKLWLAINQEYLKKETIQIDGIYMIEVETYNQLPKKLDQSQMTENFRIISQIL